MIVTGLACAAALAAVPRFALASLATPGFYGRDSQMRAEAAADATIPAGVTVDAAQMLGPQLSGRDTVLLWGPSATSAAWIVAQTHYTYPFRSLSGQRAQSGTWNGAATGWPSAAAGISCCTGRPPPGREPGATRLRHTRVH